jgi:predicted DNA binding CopG/RHH family protein
MTPQHISTDAADKQAAIEHTLDDYERELLQAFEEGKLIPTTGPISDKDTLEEAARTTMAKFENLTIRIAQSDLQALKQCAAQEGIPYHILISNILHKYVMGQLVSQPTTS